MKRRFFTAAAAFALCGPSFAQADPLPAMQETPIFAEQVKSGALPPVDKRVPEAPSIVKSFAGADGPGRLGGQVNMLVANARDTRLMTLYANARLIVYDDRFKLQPDILQSYEVKDSREFTFHLRPGHKWSDGEPFTTEDFRYFWEDIANNKELSPGGPNVELMVDGKPPKVEIIDERTIRYSWDKPNPYFIESQARAAPLFLFRPAHYLKKLHGKYTPEEDILKLYKGSNWVNIYRRQDVMYGNSNVDMPTLNPWVLTTVPPAQRFVFARNPYYHRIDQKGQQLPYIDDVIMTVVAANLIPAKAGLGEADLQPRYLNMRDYTFLQSSAKTSGVKVHLWESGSGSQIAGTGTLQRLAVPVAGGVFTVALDFGSVFTVDTYLEIGVRSAGVGGYSTLSCSDDPSGRKRQAKTKPAKGFACISLASPGEVIATADIHIRSPAS